MGAECFITYQITTEMPRLHNFTLPKRVGSVQRVLLRRPHECTRNSACIIAAAAALLFLVRTYCAAIISQGEEGSPHGGREEGKRGLPLDLEIEPLALSRAPKSLRGLVTRGKLHETKISWRNISYKRDPAALLDNRRAL